MFEDFKYIIVGSGFFGATLAERIANDLGEKVKVIERRPHFGGNSYSEVDPETGIEFHKYGSHIFHTQNKTIWEYVNQFSRFNQYRHKVWTTYQGQVYSMPINLATINQFYQKAFSPLEAQDFIRKEIERDRVIEPKNLEEQAVNLIGRPLYDAFISGYTAKQWETNPLELPLGIITRLPIRYNYDNSYFSDLYQGIPVDGYCSIFKKMFESKRISISLNTDFFDLRSKIQHDCTIIYTGPIDRYFNYQFGELSWRTIDLEKEVLGVSDFLGTSVMNYADRQVPYTRIHEFKHFHPERKYVPDQTLIFREYSRFAKKSDEPYYPINQDKDRARLALYKDLVAQEKNVIFGGRLGSYKYFDMHQAIGAALLVYERDIKSKVLGRDWKSSRDRDYIS